MKNKTLSKTNVNWYLYIVITFMVISSTAFSSDRLEADRKAKDFFLNANFFFDGRGIHDAPGQFNRAKIFFGLLPWNASYQDLSPTAKLLSKQSMKTLGRAAGINIVDGRAVGFFETRHSNIPVTVMSCVACHSGKAAGVFILGLGNKGINMALSPSLTASALEVFDKTLGAFTTQSYDPIASFNLRSEADRMQKIRSDTSFVSPTQGLVENNVVYRTFFEAFGRDYPSGQKSYLNKVPHLWGIVEKKKLGKFWDAAADATAPGWTVPVEIMNGQTAETIGKPEYLNKIEDIENSMNDFLPPRYPFELREINAIQRGKIVFESLCLKCHGSYEKDLDGLPIYKIPRLIPVSVVKTDPRRSEFFRDPEFWKAAAESSFRDLIRMSPNFDINQARYVAPRLEGIWARFPYLHNASVPTLWTLLNPDLRPRLFSLTDAGEKYRFNSQDVGLTTPKTILDFSILQNKADRGAKDVFDIRRPGHSNQGHRFGSNFSTYQKRDLIEYLKTL